MTDDRHGAFMTMLRDIEERYLIGLDGVRELWLIRHADAYHQLDSLSAGALDPPLSERGRAQAALLAERLRPLGFAEIWSSDLLRASQTAEAIAAVSPRAELRADPRLREVRTHWDEGGTSKLNKVGEWPFPEPLSEVVARMRASTTAILADLAARNSRRAAVVTHSAALAVYLSDVLGIEYGKFPLMPQFTSVSVVLAREERLVVQSIADVSHLAAGD